MGIRKSGREELARTMGRKKQSPRRSKKRSPKARDARAEIGRGRRILGCAIISLAGHLLAAGERLFTPGEHGHPYSLGAYLAGRYRAIPARTSSASSPRTARADPLAEIERINAINRRNMQRIMNPPTAPKPYQPPSPVAPQSHQPQLRR